MFEQIFFNAAHLLAKDRIFDAPMFGLLGVNVLD